MTAQMSAWLTAEDIGVGWLKHSLEKAARRLHPAGDIAEVHFIDRPDAR